MAEFDRACIRGYHVYKEIWAAAVGEELACTTEPHNSHDRYAVSVKAFLAAVVGLASCLTVGKSDCLWG